MTGVLRVFPDTDRLVVGAATFIIDILVGATEEREIATMLLSGGKTPEKVYEKLGSEGFKDKVDWQKVHLFWGDERAVPPTSSESNFGMTKRAFLDRVEFPPANIHRIKGELQPSVAAAAYEEEVRSVFSIGNKTLPTFDLVLLGLGEDGHTASLFPGNSALSSSNRLFVDTYVEELNSYRVTVTLPGINYADCVIFIITGKSKSAILQKVLQDNQMRYPAQLVQPTRGKLFWFVDGDASSRIAVSPT